VGSVHEKQTRSSKGLQGTFTAKQLTLDDGNFIITSLNSVHFVAQRVYMTPGVPLLTHPYRYLSNSEPTTSPHPDLTAITE